MDGVIVRECGKLTRGDYRIPKQGRVKHDWTITARKKEQSRFVSSILNVLFYLHVGFKRMERGKLLFGSDYRQAPLGER